MGAPVVGTSDGEDVLGHAEGTVVEGAMLIVGASVSTVGRVDGETAVELTVLELTDGLIKTAT